jgi:hypothetical protein
MNPRQDWLIFALVGLTALVLSFPWHTERCWKEWDTFSGQMIDHCEDKVQPLLYDLLGW